MSEVKTRKRKYKFPQVKVCFNLKKAEPLYSEKPITSQEEIIEVMAEVLAELDREYLCVVNLNNRKQPINYNVVAIGDEFGVDTSVANVFKSSLLTGATSIIILHNHVSGSLNPSEGDLEVTEKFIKAGEMLDIAVLDHIIVAGKSGKFRSLELTTNLFDDCCVEYRRAIRNGL